MAKSIDKKNKKMQRTIDGLREEGFGTQEEAKKDIDSMETQVETGARSSRLKKLSDAKKKEALAEYEKIIEKLKELELRNKKKQSFKHKFKGLQYFPTLNGRSVYSENMQSQAKADKDSISAMMAYSQLETGFNVTFEMMSARIRPERREEFLTLCKSKPELAHKLTGMTKLIQFYNQRDFTRAYAAMVFFGLENDMELMETFLKVKFDGVFKMQINDFKAKIAHASAFDEKEIRANAGMNVFSQTDSIATSMESSYRNKDVIDTFIATANIKDPKEKEKARNEVYSTIYTQAYQAANGNLKVVRELVSEKIHALYTAEIKTVVATAASKFNEGIASLESESGDVVEIAGTKYSKSAAIAAAKNAQRKQVVRAASKAFLQQFSMMTITSTDSAEIKKLKIMANGLDKYTRASTLLGGFGQSQIEWNARLENAETPEERALAEEKLRDLEVNILKVKIIKECNSDGFEYEKIQRFNDKIGLERMREAKISLIEILSELTGYDKEISILKSQVQELDGLIPDASVIERDNLEAKKLEQIQYLEEKNSEILGLLTGEIPFSENSNIYTDLKINNQPSEIKIDKNNGEITEGHFKITEDRLIEIHVKAYESLVNMNGGQNYETLAETYSQQIDTRITALKETIAEIKTKMEHTDDPAEKRKLGQQIGPISTKIKGLEKLKATLYEKRDEFAENERRRQEESSKTPEQKFQAVINYMDSRLKTKVAEGEERYLDELSPEETPERITDEVLLRVVNDVIDKLYEVYNLEIKDFSKENIETLKSDFARVSTLLERLKEKMPDYNFDELDVRTNFIEGYLEELESTRENTPVSETGSEVLFGEVRDGVSGETQGQSQNNYTNNDLINQNKLKPEEMGKLKDFYN